MPPKGCKHSEESKRKMGESQKGHGVSEETRKKISVRNKGKSRSEEAVRNISEAHKGLKVSEETRRKMSESQKGHIVSEETRKKLSEHFRGIQVKPFSEEHRNKLSVAAKRQFAEVHHSEETCKKISDSLRGKPGHPNSDETRKKLSIANTGRVVSYETRKKISESLKGRPHAPRSEEYRENIRKGWVKRVNNRNWPYPRTGIEKTFAVLLDNLGEEYSEQYPTGQGVYDFYLSGYNLLIETHGSFWHADPRFYGPPYYPSQRQTIEKDKIKKESAISKGYGYAIFWEHDIMHDRDYVINQIKVLTQKENTNTQAMEELA